MKRATYWAALAVAALHSCSGESSAPAPAEAPSEPERYDILLVSFDTTRADHVTSYGYERSTTPNLDRLAAQGHRFTDAYTVMNTTLPSHAAAFTSLPPASLGVLKNGDRLPDPALTLPELLGERGYVTGGFVSAAPLHPSFGFAQGFDEYDAPPRRRQRKADVTVEATLAWLDTVGDTPSFTFVHFYDPHARYDAPAEFRARMDAGDMVQPVYRKFPETLEGYDDEFRRATVNAYDAEILFADHQLGVLLDGLAERGRLDRTIVAVFSDHGESIEEFLECCNYLFSHGDFLSPHELRIPLVMQFPEALGLGAGVVHDELVSTLDLLPTLFELIGFPPPAPIEGSSLLPLLRGEAVEARTLVCSKHTNPKFRPDPIVEGGEWAVVRDDLMWVLSERRGEHLFRDGEPIPTTEVAPELLSSFRSHLDEWRRAHRSPLWGSGEAEIDPELLQELKDLGYF